MQYLIGLWRAHRGTIVGLSVVAGLCALRFALGLPCPVQYLTGISCPGCGITRGLWGILTLDFSAAWHYHPAAFALPVVGVLWGMLHLRGCRRAETAVWLGFALLLVAVYLWRLCGHGEGVVVVDPHSGLIGRWLSS